MTITVLALLIAHSPVLAHASLVPGPDSVVGGVPTNTYDIVSADFNADDVADLAISRDNGVTIFLGLGDAEFAESQTFGTGAEPSQVVKGDLDRDGIIDLVTSNFQSDDVSILYGLGNGEFSPSVSVEVGEEPSALTLGRFDEDRYPDIAVTNFGDRHMSILLSRRQGTRFRRSDVRTSRFGSGIAVGHIYGKAKRDLAVAANERLDVLSGDGRGAFTRRQRIDLKRPIASLSDVIVNDVSSSRKPDLIGLSVGDSRLYVFSGKRGESFGKPRKVQLESPPLNARVSDLDGDGKRDLVVGSEGFGNPGDPGFLSLLPGASSGIFGPRIPFQLQGAGGRLAVNDLDGDDLDDVAIITYTPDPMVQTFLQR